MTDIWLQLRHKPEPLTRVNVVHFNDMHENVENLDSFITGRDEFYKTNPNGINLTLAAGDIFNRFPQNERIVSNFVKNYVDATATGNRDLEKGKRLSKSIKKYGINDKFVGTNVYYTDNNPLQNQILKTKIVNGIGIIGLAPVDYKARIKKKGNKGIQTEDLDKTIQTITKEVDNFEKQGINKIFILAHTGEFSGHSKFDRHDIDYYKKLSEISGVDVIIGGHDHRQTDRWETTKRGEPVKIVSTGNTKDKMFDANLDSFGEMSLIFDKNGVLQKDKCKNKFLQTNQFPKSGFVEQYPHKIINWGKVTEKTVSCIFGIKNTIKSWFHKNNNIESQNG